MQSLRNYPLLLRRVGLIAAVHDSLSSLSLSATASTASTHSRTINISRDNHAGNGTNGRSLLNIRTRLLRANTNLHSSISLISDQQIERLGQVRLFCSSSKGNEEDGGNIDKGIETVDDGRDVDVEDKDNVVDTSRTETQEMADYYSQYLEEYYEPVGESEEEMETKEEEKEEEVVSLERGDTDVFEVHELVELVRAERAVDVVCIRMPSYAVSADYMIICTAFNRRHLDALVAKVRILYKRKRRDGDKTVQMTGNKGNGWRSVSMQTIVLHVMLQATRDRYDLEQLWAVGPDMDDQTQGLHSHADQREDDEWLFKLPSIDHNAPRITSPHFNQITNKRRVH